MYRMQVNFEREFYPRISNVFDMRKLNKKIAKIKELKKL